MKRAIYVMALMAAMLLTGCDEKPVSATGFYLDTVISITAYGTTPEALQEALQQCTVYEQLLSKTAEGSDVWRINHAGGQPVGVSEHTIRVLEAAQRVSELTQGAFDISVAPAMELWDFSAEQPALPDPDELRQASQLIDYRNIRIEGRTVQLLPGMGIDLGGIAKGYIADEIAAYCANRGIKSALLNFGGNLVALGSKPDGSAWTIGVQDPQRLQGTYLVAFEAKPGESVVTSGNYQRYFMLDGERYHHILDPETGQPVRNGLGSVTVFADQSVLADAFSTALFVMGKEAGLAFAENMEGIQAVFVEENGAVSMTSGLQALDG